jgi:hypothetical protein
MGYQEELIARESEDKERQVMMPGFDASAREDGAPGYRVHVYLVSNPSRPYVTFHEEDRAAAVIRAQSLLVSGILDLDGEFIPVHRITKILLQEEIDEWQVQTFSR